MAFHLGSLGFLTPFKFDTYQTQVTQIIEGTWGVRETRRMQCFSSFVSTQSLARVCCNAGNAAIVLRSRLKVRVLKANMEKKARVDEKGIILTNGDVESSWKAVQYQVTAKETNQSAGFSPSFYFPIVAVRFATLRRLSCWQPKQKCG